MSATVAAVAQIGMQNKMIAELAKFRCEQGHIFEAPLLSDFRYGEFLLWSASGEVTYLNVFEDSCYDELGHIIKCIYPARSSLDASEILKRIFGKVACDTDKNGNNYNIEQIPHCPYDKSIQNRWEMIMPVRYQEVECVTHRLWNSLDVEQKKQRVIDELNK